MFTIKELQGAAKSYRSVRCDLEGLVSTVNPVEMVTPINLTEAKENWITEAENGHFGNPVFVYDSNLLSKIANKLATLDEVRKEIVWLKPQNEAEGFLRRHYTRVIDDASLTARMARTMRHKDDKSLRTLVLCKYGKPGVLNLPIPDARFGGIVFSEEQILKLKDVTLDASFIKEIFVWSMEQYGVEPWPVEILKNCSSIDVRDKNSSGRSVIAIPASRKVNGLKLAELVGHEIECHWRNSQNNMIIGCLKTDDEIIYEGVAKLKDMSFQMKTTGKATMPSPYHIMAEDMALQGKSFAEVARSIFDVTGSVKKAWTFTYRAFRGVTDTVNAAGYAFTKDKAYLEGMLYVEELVKAGLSPYLNFAALGIADFGELISSIDKESMAKSPVLVDLDIQSKVLSEIERRL